MPNVYEYLDYRKFLKDTYAFKKAKSRAFSHRSFLRLAGFRSSNFFKFVVDGKRNLSPSAVQRFAQALQLQDRESAFFTNLVFFNQAKTARERRHYYEILSQSSDYQKAKPLETHQYAYFSKWHLVALRELVGLADFREDAHWIDRRLGLDRSEGLSEREIQRALKALIELGLLKRDSSGRLKQVESRITTDPEIADLGVANYHRQMAQKACDSIERTRPGDRDLSALTVGLDRRQFEKIRAEIARFRSRLHHLASSSSRPDAVYQINFHLFNLSEVPWP